MGKVIATVSMPKVNMDISEAPVEVMVRIVVLK